MIELEPAAFARFVLPVSGIGVALRHPTGLEDMLLAEGGLAELRLALAIVESLAGDPMELDLTALPACDLEALLLLMRRTVFGDRILSDIPCTAAECGARIDISFSVDAYLHHHRPRQAPLRRRDWSVLRSAERHGWYNLTLRNVCGPFSFRLPTIGDQLGAGNGDRAADTIAHACLEPADMPARARRAAERAMQLLAPSLTDELQGLCPECGATVTALFEPRHYCLTELRGRARFLYEDVNTLALRYGWSESAILALPSARRSQYAELARAV